MTLSPQALAIATAIDAAANTLNPPVLVQAPEVPGAPPLAPSTTIQGLSARDAQAAEAAMRTHVQQGRLELADEVQHKFAL